MPSNVCERCSRRRAWWCSSGGGSVVAVDRVDDAADEAAQGTGRMLAGDLHELRFEGCELGGPFGGVGVGDDGGVGPGDVPGRERGGNVRELFEFAGEVDVSGRDAVVEPAGDAQCDRGVGVPRRRCIPSPVVGGDLVEHRGHAGFEGTDIGCDLLDSRYEHMFEYSQKSPTNKEQSRSLTTEIVQTAVGPLLSYRAPSSRRRAAISPKTAAPIAPTPPITTGARAPIASEMSPRIGPPIGVVPMRSTVWMASTRPIMR